MKYRIMITILFLLIILAAVFGSITTGLYDADDHNEVSIIEADSFSPDFSKRKITAEEVGLQEYTVVIPKDKFIMGDDNGYTFIINKITDHALEVSFNGELVYSAGDLINGNANFKGSFHHFTVSKERILSKNTLVIKTYARYKTGIETEGIIVTNTSNAKYMIQRLSFYSNNVVYFGIGFLCFAAIFIIIVYIMFKAEHLALLYTGIATLFIIVFFTDFLVLNLTYDYLLFKKIALMSLYISALFYMLAISRFFNSKFIRFSTVSMLILFTIATVASPTIIIYKSYYDIAYFLFFILVVYAFILSIVKIRRNQYAYIITLNFLCLGSYTAFVLISDLIDIPFAYNSPVVYIIVMATLPLMIGVDTIYQHREELLLEKKLHRQEYLNANIDGLTGAWNQRYLSRQLEKITSESLVAIIDIDDFKTINDQYGHLAGDEALKQVSQAIQEILPPTAVFCRYGGDEFVILENEMSKTDFIHLLENVRKLIAEMSLLYDKYIFNVTISIGYHKNTNHISVSDLLRKADESLYRSKEKGKNRIS